MTYTVSSGTLNPTQPSLSVALPLCLRYCICLIVLPTNDVCEMKFIINIHLTHFSSAII